MSLSFSDIYQKHSQRIYNVALSYLQHSEDAEEVTQDVFMKIHDEINEFKGDANIDTWVMRITINKCLDCIRKKKRLRSKGILISFFSNMNEWHGKQDTPDFNHLGFEKENHENAKILFRALDMLSNSQRTAFILAFLEDMPQKEVANIMNLNSVKALESLLQRAKQNLRKILENEYDKLRITKK